MEHPGTDVVEIVVATPDAWQAAREIRLEALLRNPEAYSSTYAEAVDRSENGWRSWLSRPGLTMLLARTAERPVGIVGGLRGDDAGDESMGWVVSMYVTAEFRQRGVGRRLLQTLLDELARDATLTRVRLNVTASQAPAQRLYTSLGFEPVGEEDGEILMERPLR
jgi:ribosomal protein S18 acetylase RimI-like enzyme